MLQHLFRSVLLEVDQFKQLDLVSLRGEDQLIFFPIEAHFKGNLVKGQVQDFLHLGCDLRAAFVVPVPVHHPAQLCLLPGKGFPPVFHPLPEAL